MLLSRRSLTSWSYLVAALQQTIARRRRPQGHSLAEELLLQGDEPGPQQHLRQEHAEGDGEGRSHADGHIPTYERVDFAESCWRLLRLATWDIIYPDSYFRMAWWVPCCGWPGEGMREQGKRRQVLGAAMAVNSVSIA